MDCRKWVIEIVECARQGSAARAGLQEHLSVCPRCSERWEDQKRLSAAMQAARSAAVSRRPAGRREEIMREFARMHPQTQTPRSWPKWALAAAAMLVLTFGLGRVLWTGSHAGTPATAALESSRDADGADNSGFIAVPYAPPLAAGEIVSVERTELEPAALARLGILVDASYGSSVPAEVVAGQDGLPRAVRVIETAEF